MLPLPSSQTSKDFSALRVNNQTTCIYNPLEWALVSLPLFLILTLSTWPLPLGLLARAAWPAAKILAPVGNAVCKNIFSIIIHFVFGGKNTIIFKILTIEHKTWQNFLG